MRRQPSLSVAALGLLVLASKSAYGHQASVVYSTALAKGSVVRWRIELAAPDLVEALGTRPSTRELLLSRAGRLGDYLSRRITVRTSGEPCAPALGEIGGPTSGDPPLVDVGLEFRCPHRIEKLTIRYDLFFDLDPSHEGHLRIELPGEVVRNFVFRQGERSWDVGQERSALWHAAEFVVLGIEHIFTGYDHIAFLCGLLLILGRRQAGAFRATILVVTAFTLAHSLTLVGSALGAVTLHVRLTEAAIALSIAWVGLENLLAEKPRHRPHVAFGFGLVHGFGFASVLGAGGLPRGARVLSLLSFNLGVELGQLAIVALLLPLFVIVARRATSYERFIVRPASTLLVLFGVFWLVERLAGRTLFGGWLGQ